MSLLVILLAVSPCTPLPSWQPSDSLMPPLRLAYMVEEQEYRRPEQEQGQEQEVRRQEQEHSRVRRQGAGQEEVPPAAATVDPDCAADPHSNRCVINRVLKAAGNPPSTKVDSDIGSYSSGRRRRSPQEPSQSQATEELTTLAPSSAAASWAATKALILAAANAKPTPVDPSGSYSGRRRRSPEAQSNSQSITTDPPTAFFDQAALVAAIKAAKENPRSGGGGGGGYGRKRRSPEAQSHSHSNAHQYGLLEPSVELVKVKSHGNHGRVAQTPVVVTKENLKLLNGQVKERRKRSDNFIPFSEYEAQRVTTLTLEENDFHALPQRMALEQEQLARQARVLRMQLSFAQ